jgi:hypothetical protein
MLEPQNPEWVKFPESMMPLMRIPAQIMAAEFHKGGSSYDLALITNFLHPFSIHPPAPLLWSLRLAAMRIHSPNSKEFLKVPPSHESISPLRKSALIDWSLRTGELRKSP